MQPHPPWLLRDPAAQVRGYNVSVLQVSVTLTLEETFTTLAGLRVDRGSRV